MTDSLAAKIKLSQAERMAGKRPPVPAKGVQEVRKLEQEPAGERYISRVVGREPKPKKKGGLKGWLRGKGAIFSALVMLSGVGAVIMGSHSTMMFSLFEQFRLAHDSITTPMELRANSLLRLQLNHKKIKNPIARGYFGIGGSEHFKVSDKQKTKLAKQGIYVEDDFGGSGKSVMLFDDGSGTLKVIGATEADISALKNVDLNDINLKNEIDMGKFKIDTSNAKSFDGAFEDLPDFRNGYTKSSKTWRGAVGAWFDSVTLRFLQSNVLTRNRFLDFQKRVQAEHNGNTRSAAIARMGEGRPEEIAINRKENNLSSREIRDKDGNVVGREPEFGVDSENNNYAKKSSAYSTDGLKTKASKEEVAAALKKAADTKAAKVSSIYSMAANGVCAVLSIAGSIQMIIAAQEGIQLFRLATSYSEAKDKVMAGDGVDSPIHDLANGLVTPADTKMEVEGGGSAADTRTEVVRKDMSAMQAEGVAALYNGKKVNEKDAGVLNFNIGARFQSIWRRLGASATSFGACALAKLSAAVMGGVTDVVKIAACFLTFGVGCAVGAVAEAAGGLLGGLAIAGIVTAIVKVITPLAVHWFTRDLISELAGEDLGNALASGVHMYMGNNHRSGGGSLATREKFKEFALEQQKVLAREAQYQRATRSPFDASSQYTFMGKMVKQMIALGTTMRATPLGLFSTVGAMTTNSLTALLPSAAAYDLSKNLMTEKEFTDNCPMLASIGAIGDAYCNPYIISDVTTLDGDGYAPDEVVEKVQTLGGLEADGQIKEDSNLARYVRYCDERSSLFGLADGNIAEDFSMDVKTGNSWADTAINTAIGKIPVIGDAQDFWTNEKQLKNAGWISGESCVAGNTVDKAVLKESPDWAENKYYQRYIEDQRLMEGISPGYKSTVTAYLDNYYEKHPLDNSYEGILARRAGMTKEKVVATLDFIRYQDYLAQYDATQSYQFGEEEKKEERIYIEAPNVEGVAILNKVERGCLEIRNRMVAVA